jgi:amino acid transporter
VYSFILELEQYPAQILSLLLAVGLVLLRYRRPDLKRPFKAWPPAVAVKIAMCLTLLASALVPPEDLFAGGLFYATYAIAGTSV